MSEQAPGFGATDLEAIKRVQGGADCQQQDSPAWRFRGEGDARADAGRQSSRGREVGSDTDLSESALAVEDRSRRTSGFSPRILSSIAV